MLKRFLVAALILFVPAQAWAVCTQADLTGIWRFNFDLGAVESTTGRTYALSCLLKIKADGAIAPGTCQTVNFSNRVGEFVIHTPNRKLQMNTATCEARFSGNAVSNSDFQLGFIEPGVSSLLFGVNAARLSISADKQTLLGWLGTADKAYVTTTALKRATP